MRIGHSPSKQEDVRPGAALSVKPLSESKIERNGIRAGSIAPEFTLLDTQGRWISLNAYRGRRLLLVFTDPHCGPCDELAPHLSRAYQRRRADGSEVLLVGRGDMDENRRKAETHGFKFPVVIQDRWKLSRQYGIFATPVAFVIGEDGRTTRDVAVGSAQILELLREEFARGPIERFTDTLHDISTVLSSPVPRRHAFRTAGLLFASALFAAVGMQKTATAVQCRRGEEACGGQCCAPNEKCCGGNICCGPGQKCCGGRTCCHANLACCNGICCAPGEVCRNGTCQPRNISKKDPADDDHESDDHEK